MGFDPNAIKPITPINFSIPIELPGVEDLDVVRAVCLFVGCQSDREVDAMLTSVLSKVNNVKGSLSSLVGKMEHEQLTW